MHRPARAGGSGSWNSWLGSRLHASGFFFSVSPPRNPNLFLPPPNAYPTRPPRRSLCSLAWPEVPGSPQAVTSAGEGEGHPDGRDWVPRCNRVQRALGEPKNGFLFVFGQLRHLAGWGRRGVRFHTPFLFLPRPLPPFAVIPSASGRCWLRRGETLAPGSATLLGAVGL